MVNFTAPYLVPLFLGMTFDARNTRPGVDIYDSKYVDDPQIMEYHKTNIFYKVVTSMKEVKEMLDISGDLSLKIKTGMIKLEGKGSYLKDEKNYDNMVEILVRLDYTSKTEFLKPKAKPRQGWAQLFTVGVLGTHYVTSVTYGAEIFTSARFMVHNSSDTQYVKEAVNKALGNGGSGNGLIAEGKLEMLEKQVSGKANLEISYYGTDPLEPIPNSIEGLRTLIRSFKEQMDEAETKNAMPISVELSSLTAIAEPRDEDKFLFIKNRDLEIHMNEFEEYLDELRLARLETIAYAKTLPFDLEEKYTNQVGHLLKTISEVLHVFYEVIWSLDLTRGGDQLKPATDAYEYGVGDSRRFRNKLLRIKQTLSEIIKSEITASSDTYIQYGNNNCTAAKSVLLYGGFTVSSAEEGIGGTSKYDCFPRTFKKGYELTEMDKQSHLAGIRYTKLDKKSNPFMGKHAMKIAEKGIPCAKCHATEASTIAVLTATDKCPVLWDLVYSGYIMTSRIEYGHSTEYVCVDGEPSEPFDMNIELSEAFVMDSEPAEAFVMDAPPKTLSKDTLTLTTIHSQGSLPADTYPEGALIRCAVCAL